MIIIILHYVSIDPERICEHFDENDCVEKFIYSVSFFFFFLLGLFLCLLFYIFFVKGMVGELNMWEGRANEYKYELDNVVKELRDLKGKYYTLKRKNQRIKETDGQEKNFNDTYSSLPSLSSSHKKFCGGGFTMTVAPSRNCYSLDSMRK